MKAQKIVRLHKPDPIFFDKLACSVGTRFGYHGATGRSEWEVSKIVTLLRNSGMPQERVVQDVRVLNDVVHLRRVDGPLETRRAMFCYLRYSAIWRLHT